MKKNYLKNLSYLIIILSTTLALMVVGIKNTHSIKASLDTKIYTRKEIQEMVVSTALSFYYNSYFSDYGQTAMDNVEISGNYFNYGNFLWRDLNVSPESVGYSKYYHIDCSGYNFLIYKNTIGYDMSEYNVVNRYRLFDKDRKYPIHRVSFYSGDERLIKYRESYERFGYGMNSNFLSSVVRKAANNCGDSNCTKLAESTSTEPFIYNNIDGKDNNEVVYYFEARNAVTLKTAQENYAIAEAALEPGDIIAYTKYDASKDETSGHVMFYAGDDIMTSSKKENGFTDLLLHSTGNGGGDYTSSPTSKNNKLYKKTSIIASSAKDYIDGVGGRFEEVYKNEGDYVVRFSVIRPINTICESDTECKIKNNSYNVQLTDTQLNNNEARVVLKKTQVQQYMIVEKKYNNQTFVTSSDENGETRNVISEYNSVNVGDNVIYKLRLKNKLDQTDISGIRVEAVVPDNASYVTGSCSDNCKKEGNKLIWENISISGENTNKDITFSIKPKEEGNITFSGYTIIKDNKILQLDSKTINILPTQNGINKEILRETVRQFQTLVEKGQIKYVTDGSHSENITSLNELITNPSKTVSISTFGYIKMVYYNAFGLDLDTLTGTEVILTGTRIRDAIFDLVPYPEINNLLSKNENGEYPKIPEDAKTPKIFAKKTKIDNESLIDIYKKISQMLVPGLYGGKHLKGNDNNDRIKFLRSFYNNKIYQSDLEVGDIIIQYTSDASSIRTYLYLGDDGENGAILTRFTNSNSQQPLFLYHTDQYLDTYYNDEELQKKTTNKPSSQILNELFSKDLFVVLRPSRLGTTVEYDYNGGIQGTESYVAYTTYQNLVIPTKENKKMTLISNFNSQGTGTTFMGKSSFVCWTTDSELKNCITNKSELVSTDYHKVYAKWDDALLPELTLEGYTHVGWYADVALTEFVAKPNTSIYAIEETTLYAKWEPNEYIVTFNANGGTGTMSNQIFTYDTSQKISSNTFTRVGYKFNGWNTKADGSGVSYTNEQEISISENTTLYAKWKETYSYIINKYLYDNNKMYIYKIDINTTVDSYKKNIDLNTGYSIDVSYKTIDGKNYIYTGSKTKIYNNNNLIIEYTNIIMGEVTGDGKINYLDYVNVYNHIQKVKHPESTKKELKQEYLISADMSGDGKVNYLDYVKIYNKIKELKGGN